MESLKSKVHEILEEQAPGSRLGQIVSLFIISLISLNVAALILGTVEDIHQVSPKAFRTFEITSVAVFTIEYLLRVWSCTSDPRYSKPVSGRLRFAVSPLVLIDLLAILPFYLVALTSVHGLDLRSLRAARLFAQAARLSRYSTGLRTLARVILNTRGELFTVIMVLSLLLLLASSLMFFAENEAQPDKFASVPMAMWWSIITLTTVGYGDVYPVTAAGRVLAGLMAIVGIGLFALPAGILGSGFVEEVRRRSNGPRICPHCKREIED